MSERLSRIQRKAVAAALLVGLAIIAACGSGAPTNQQLPARMADGLAQIKTVQGRLELSMGTIQLEQELWVQTPKLLRSEIEAGPPGFKGTIQVLNQEEGWVYNPALDMATVVDRSDYSLELGGSVPGSSLLETMATDLLTAVQGDSALNVIGEEQVADRQAYHVELVLREPVGAFPAGRLNVWLDSRFYYPLAIVTEQGLEMRFQSILFNREIDPLTFVFFPPPGAMVNRAAR
jgi:outer membrane lipoprotein-sorting protein